MVFHDSGDLSYVGVVDRIASTMRSQTQKSLQGYGCAIAANAALPKMTGLRESMFPAVGPVRGLRPEALRVGAPLGGMTLRPLMQVDGVGTSFAKAVNAGLGANKVAEAVLSALGGPAGSSVGGVGFASRAAQAFRVTGVAGSPLGGLTARSFLNVEGAGSGVAKGVLAGIGANKAAGMALSSLGGPAASSLAGAGFASRVVQALGVTGVVGAPFGGLAARSFLNAEGARVGLGKTMMSSLCGPMALGAGSAAAIPSITQGLRAAGSLFAAHEAANAIWRIFRDGPRRWAVVERSEKQLDLSAEPRPDRWRHASPVIALAAWTLRVAKAAEIALVRAATRTVEAARATVSTASVMAMPFEETSAFLSQLEVSAKSWVEPWEQILRAMDALLAAFALFVLSLALAFTVRALARERNAVPCLCDAALFLLVLLMFCRRLGSRGDDASHQLSLLRRQSQPMARRVPAAC